MADGELSRAYEMWRDLVGRLEKKKSRVIFVTSVGVIKLIEGDCKAYVYTSVNCAVFCSDNGLSPVRHQAII